MAHLYNLEFGVYMYLYTHVYLCEVTCSRAYIHSAMYTSLPGILYRLHGSLRATKLQFDFVHV